MSATANHRLSPADILFAEVYLDPEAWADHVKAQAALKVRRWKEPTAFEWSYDGITYRVEPGKSEIVPAAAADHGVKSSRIFGFEKDDYGKETAKLDHDMTQVPMLEVRRRVAGTDPSLGDQSLQEAPPPADPICPYCVGEVRVKAGELRSHLEGVHHLGPVKSKAEGAMVAAQQL